MDVHSLYPCCSNPSIKLHHLIIENANSTMQVKLIKNCKCGGFSITFHLNFSLLGPELPVHLKHSNKITFNASWSISNDTGSTNVTYNDIGIPSALCIPISSSHTKQICQYLKVSLTIIDIYTNHYTVYWHLFLYTVCMAFF